MELKVLWRTLVRRWYITLAVIALATAATYVVVDRVGPTYKAEGSALVFPPAQSIRVGGATKTAGNPYLELAGVSQARDVVIRTLKSKTVRDEWSAEFPGNDFEATPDFTNSAPIILFTVEGESSADSAAALAGLMDRVPQVLDDLQGGLGLTEDNLVTSTTLTRDQVPETVRKTQVRAGILAGGVTLGLGLLLLALLESLLAGRARAKAAADPPVVTTSVTALPAKPDLAVKPAKFKRPKTSPPTGDATDRAGGGQASRHETPSTTGTKPLSPDTVSERAALTAVPSQKGRLRAGGRRG